MTEKKKCRQYSVDYLQFGFIPSPSNEQLPMCLLCEAVFSNEAMKPSRLSDHLRKKQCNMIGRQRGFVAHLKTVLPDVFAIHCVHLVAKGLSEHLNLTNYCH